ncbi:MAG: hypothetical protein GY859_32175, partial [Desulfobacterales bacterium]|nr:hypothetical protein [Desulfobacterales bacterium]
MHDIRKKIEKLEDVDGFIAAGAFNARGELMEEFSLAGTLNLEEICDLTSEALKKAGALSDASGLGKIRFLQMTSKRMNILAQCIGSRPDDSARAVAHIILVLGSDGGAALGKL